MQNKLNIIVLKSLLAGWVTIVFGTSIIVYLVNGSKKLYHSNTLLNTLRNIWEIADEMGPAVKISIVLIFGGLLYGFRKTLKNRFFYLANIFSAIIAVILVLAFLPEDMSRGYGIGLTHTRFDSKMTSICILGSVLGGIVYSLTYNQLLKKNTL